MMMSLRACGTELPDPNRSLRFPAADPSIRQLPLRADTQAIGPAECEERQMEPDVRTGLG